MENQTQEARVILAIEAIRSSKKLSCFKAAQTYNMPYSTLYHRIKGRTTFCERRPASHKLPELEEKVLARYIIDMDERGFAPRLADVEDMANYILESRGVQRVGKLWAHRTTSRAKDAF